MLILRELGPNEYKLRLNDNLEIVKVRVWFWSSSPVCRHVPIIHNFVWFWGLAGKHTCSQQIWVSSTDPPEYLTMSLLSCFKQTDKKKSSAHKPLTAITKRFESVQLFGTEQLNGIIMWLSRARSPTLISVAAQNISLVELLCLHSVLCVCRLTVAHTVLPKSRFLTFLLCFYVSLSIRVNPTKGLAVLISILLLFCPC